MRKPVFYAGRTEISVIKFDDIQVRIVSINGEPWFVGADVCAALEISNVTDAVSVLDNDEVMTLALTEGHYGECAGLLVGYSCSLALRRWRRLISPFAAVTKKPAVLSPGSLSCSISSITSCGILTVVICDFAFFAPVAISGSPKNWCMSVYAKKMIKKGLKCISPVSKLKSKGKIHLKEQRPAVLATHAGRLTKPLNEVTIMAGTQHTQTHPKFIYTFLAVHRDCIADGKNTVHVAADTLVDACEMLNDMGYISATWKGREENTLFIQKCENNFIWRFIALSTAQPRVIHIEAASEQEARQQSPTGCVMVFTARIRQGEYYA